MILQSLTKSLTVSGKIILFFFMTLVKVPREIRTGTNWWCSAQHKH